LTYRVSDAAKYLDVPSYDTEASYADVLCSYSLGASTPSFVTLDGDAYNSPKIKIYTTDETDT